MKYRFDNLIEAGTGEVIELDLPDDFDFDKKCDGPFPRSFNEIRRRASMFGARCRRIMEADKEGK